MADNSVFKTAAEILAGKYPVKGGGSAKAAPAAVVDTETDGDGDEPKPAPAKKAAKKKVAANK